MSGLIPWHLGLDPSAWPPDNRPVTPQDPKPETRDPGLTLPEAHLRRLAENALAEDRAWEDVTTTPLVPDDQRGRGVIIAKAPGVIAGLPMAQAVFAVSDASLAWLPQRQDGDHLSPGDRVVTIEGPLPPILRAERVALNYLSHLSGVATATARVVQALQGTNCRLRDTRKTVPGLRTLEKYAVRVGGGTNHRPNLAQGVLVKDNHLAALRSRGLGIADALRLAREGLARLGNPDLPIEIEVTTVDEARQALAAGADELLLDNMPLDRMREVVALATTSRSDPDEPASSGRRPLLEASGGITLDNARQIAQTGVDFISLGAITHSAKALDLSLEIETL